MLKPDAATRMKHARWSLGWSLEDWRAKSGVAVGTLRKIEAGDKTVRGDRVYAAAKALGIEPASLYADEVVA